MPLKPDENRLSRVAQVEQILVPHRQFQTVVKRLELVLEAASNGAEPRHTLLVGESGSGKTWVARYMQSVNPATFEDGFNIKPVVLVSTPSAPTLKTLAEAILIALGDQYSMTGTAEQKRYRALLMMRKCHVQLLVIEEIQHFLDHGIRHSTYAVADWLKVFIEDAGIPCLLMGLPRATAILSLNEQLRRRFAYKLELKAFSIETAVEEEEFRSVLDALDDLIPSDRRSELATVELSRRIYFATDGLIGYVKKLLVGAVEEMIESGYRKIELENLRAAFAHEIWCSLDAKSDPFHPNFAFRRLTRVGEPFAESGGSSVERRSPSNAR